MSDINFSIIIPHYNIPELLEHLLSTTPYDREDVEVIVVDDRSDRFLDRFYDLKRRFEAQGVYFYRNNNKKKGAGTCRNIGLKHAVGKWILFADADDRFIPGMYGIIKRFVNDKGDIVFFETDSISENGRSVQGRSEGYNLKVENYSKTPNKRNELLLRYDMPVPWGKLYRKKMIDENGIIFPNIMVSEDAVFNCKCGYASESISSVREKIYIVSEREHSLSTDKNIYKFKLQVNAFAHICGYIKARITSEEWKILGFNGNLKMIEAYRDYGVVWMMYVFTVFALNGIKPVSFKGMSIKTGRETLKKIVEGRSI